MTRLAYLLVILSAPAAYLVWRFIGSRFAERRLGPTEADDLCLSLGYEDPYEWDRPDRGIAS